MRVIFSNLFFTLQVVDAIGVSTNTYATANTAASHACYANSNGPWNPTTGDEIYSLPGLFQSMAYNKLLLINKYNCTDLLFDGNYTHAVIPSRKHFEALLAFLKVVDHKQEYPNDRLRKVRFLYDNCARNASPSSRLGNVCPLTTG